MSFLTLHNNNKAFFDQIVMCVEKWILCDNLQCPALDGPRRSSKALPKTRLTLKKTWCSAWWSADSMIHYSFPAKPVTSEKYAQQMDEIHWETQCLRLVLVNRMGPILLCITQPKLQKLNDLGYKVVPHPPYSPDLLSTSYHFFKHLNNFLQGKCFHNQHEAENAFQEFIKSWSMDFYAIGVNKLISHRQRCVDCNGFYFD